MRFWLCASFSLFLSGTGVAQTRTNGAKGATGTIRANEFSLAGVRPGKDGKTKAAIVNKAFGSPRTEDGTTVWFDQDACEKINVDEDNKGLIQSVRLSVNVFNGQKTCMAVPNGTGWKTGRGLSLRTPCAEAVKLYGEPTSRSPSTKNGQPLELLYYAFDWAGPDVPQVLEVVCTAPKEGTPGRVVEITLAAGSL
jgi:hypothetical protein